MSSGSEFRSAVAAAAQQPGMTSRHLTGSRLAWAAAHVLNAQGAGISLSGDHVLRLPWGASDDDAEAAERLQFTAGEGPCMTAYADQHPIMATQAVIERTWPGFAELLFTRTPYRSVYSAPLHQLGSTDVYFTDPTGSTRIDVAAAQQVANHIIADVIHDPTLATLASTELWQVPAVDRRTQVSMAIGRLIAALQVNPTNALTLLRIHAFTHGRTVDDIAVDITAGVLHPDQLAG